MLIAVISLTAMNISCQQASKPAASDQLKQTYFDVPQFIQTEIDSLKKRNPVIQKTVFKDQEEETKSMKISDWDAEFASFKNIDLNKPAYAGQIAVDTIDQVVQYHFLNPKSDLSCVRIQLDSLGNPMMLSIEKQVKNKLYQTSEFLVYEKGSFYLLEKNQDVQVMGENYYKVQGNF
ncbi:hypothetical protein [Sphingobacterium sp. HJSM2_6]|uniref:hypothetical protein n=1 Tax=Sphingobacterium sp. HJSM2_6 TaxID=3366264 RepID=UPI003BF4B678